MSIEIARAQARSRTEARMADACTSRRKDGPPVYDDATGSVAQPYDDIYAGPCRLKEPNARASRSAAGEAAVLLQEPELHLPMSAPMHRPGDEITLTASQGDPLSARRVFIVRAVPAYSDATARRYGVTERTS